MEKILNNSWIILSYFLARFTFHQLQCRNTDVLLRLTNRYINIIYLKYTIESQINSSWQKLSMRFVYVQERCYFYILFWDSRRLLLSPSGCSFFFFVFLFMYVCFCFRDWVYMKRFCDWFETVYLLSLFYDLCVWCMNFC